MGVSSLVVNKAWEVRAASGVPNTQADPDPRHLNTNKMGESRKNKNQLIYMSISMETVDFGV